MSEKDPALNENYMNYPKYSREAPFMDPVLRCTQCKQLIKRLYLQSNGACSCGCRRVSEVRTLSEEEFEKLKEVYPDFAAVFQPVAEDGRL